MKKFRLTLLASLLVGGLAAILSSATVEAYTCLTPSTAQPTITVSGTTATAQFTLPKGCKNIDVTLVSYKAPNGTDGKPYSQQTLYKSVTRNYNVEGRREIKVAVPDCFYQVDLVIGQPVSTFPGDEPIYHHEHRFLLAKQGGSKSCTQPAPAPVAPLVPTPPPTPVTPAINITNTNINNPPVQPVTPAAATAPAPTEPVTQSSGKLPDTGPGTIAAFGFGSTFMASIMYAYRSRFSDILAQLINKYHL